MLCSYLDMFKLFMYCDVAVLTPDELTYTALVMISIYIYLRRYGYARLSPP